MIGRELELRGNLSELFSPISKLPLEQVAPQYFPLPNRIISILHRQVRERYFRTGRNGGVKGGDFLCECGYGKPIKYSVMYGEDNNVIFLAQTQKRHSK